MPEENQQNGTDSVSKSATDIQLDATSGEHEQALQHIRAKYQAENRELQRTIQSLRAELEHMELTKDSEIQKSRADNAAETRQLMDTARSLREELERSGADAAEAIQRIRAEHRSQTDQLQKTAEQLRTEPEQTIDG